MGARQPRQQVTLRLPRPLWKQIKILAIRRGQTVTALVEQRLRDALAAPRERRHL